MARLIALGGLELQGVPFRRTKALLLLAYLTLEGPQRRKHLAELFWRAGNRMKSLSMALTLLRQGAGEVVGIEAKYVKAVVSSDVQDLLGTLDAGHWEKAAQLYTGAFLEGVALDDWGSELEEWIYGTRERLAERVQFALLELAEAAAAARDFEVAGRYAERAYRLPGLAGTEATHLERLYALLCAGGSFLAPEVAKEAESYGMALNLTTKEARATFEHETTPAPALPMRGTSFVGRDVELTELATLLNRENVSLLTLLGPPGVGKTRLALQLAHDQHRLGAFEGGVYFVPLEALDDADLLPARLTQHLELRPEARRGPLEQLVHFIAARRMLFVLDNVEGLTGGTEVLLHLLGRCPKLKLLVTSRETLRLEEEYIFPVGGLPLPKVPAEAGKLADAVQLFRERAQQVAPHFDLEAALPDVLKICRLVEGLPLGIELAAGWVRLMLCAEIAGEIGKDLDFLESPNRNLP